jgi:hypothetical protein
MAYVHCMPARVTELRHGLDNLVQGVLRTARGDISFKTRGHIVKATNKIYRGCPWKPAAGQDVLVDGDLVGDAIIVDHIEQDLYAEPAEGASSPHLESIGAMLPRHPPASKTLRVCRDGDPVRIRFVAMASKADSRGRITDEVVHAAWTEGRWAIWTVARDGGGLASSGINAAVLPIIARAAGLDMIAGETDREKAERIERDEVAIAREARQAAAAAPPPFDDCPF